MLKAIKEIFRRELRLTARDINIITIIILAPLFYSFFYGSIYMKKVEREVPVVVLDEDHSQTTKNIIRHLDAHQMINIVGSVNDFKSGIDKINSREAYGLIYFAKDFESGLKLYKGATVKTYLNTTLFLVSNDINIAVNEVIINENSDIKLKFFEKAGYSYEQSQGLIEPVKYEIRSLYNTAESYGEFLIPGILILIIQQTLLIGLAESLAKEREMGTAGELYEMGGRNIFAIIQGKGLLFFILYSAFSFMFFTFQYWVFNMQIHGSIFVIAIFTFLLVTASIYFGIFIASFFKRKIMALQFLTISSYPVFFVSGYSWPLMAMPLWVRHIGDFLPSTPFMSAFIRITRMNAGLNETMPEFLHLLCLTVFLYIIAHLRLKQLFKKSTSNKEVTL
jgi:ABC-2 type transport system permease protein